MTKNKKQESNQNKNTPFPPSPGETIGKKKWTNK